MKHVQLVWDDLNDSLLMNTFMMIIFTNIYINYVCGIIDIFTENKLFDNVIANLYIFFNSFIAVYVLLNAFLELNLEKWLTI